ncbi:MAG: hypothetical protein KDA84_16015 [Planctomycetaceae bacterium]|nr:hypothetical protein [Planctomycetaceae bacterium]
MPQPSPAESSVEPTRPDRELARPTSVGAVPGWMVSGILHAGVIVFLITSGLPSCGDGQYGTGAEQGDFREVGIYVKQPSESLQKPEETNTDDNQNPTDNPTTNNAAAESQNDKATDAIADALISVPNIDAPSVIGMGGGAPAEIGTPSDSQAMVTPNAVKAPQSPGQGPGDVSFLGLNTKAQSVVYVIDTSGSMVTHDALGFAKTKLMASINGLSPKQQFQIISYSETTTVMHLRNEKPGSFPLYPAVGPNLILATRHINSLGAGGGTKHMPAIRAAFSFHPDVIFLLSDAETDLGPKDLSEIRLQLNKGGKTHVHCIKFGEGPDLKSRNGNFLRDLAAQNKGSYSYLNVEKLDGS